MSPWGPTEGPANTLLGASAIVFVYGRHTALRDCDAHLPEGSMTALLGPNGAGKSTLLRIMAGIATPQSGTVRFAETTLHTMPHRTRVQRIAYVPQHCTIEFPLRVRDMVALGRVPFQTGLGWLTARDHTAVDNALATLECTAFANRLFHTLSGGEQQRVLIARALAQAPQLLLLDEPAIHLDPAAQLSVMTALQHIQRERHCTICCALHDLNLAYHFCDRAILLHAGTVRASGAVTEVMIPATLSAIYEAPIAWAQGLMARHGIRGRP
ncbi:MAG: ABC transporter ATP-binding protein [Deltaproteobacteria bacterium]|nr:ABC transporter ATP-binding protein [Deltaproteobacteria bacterium]